MKLNGFHIHSLSPLFPLFLHVNFIQVKMDLFMEILVSVGLMIQHFKCKTTKFVSIYFIYKHEPHPFVLIIIHEVSSVVSFH